MRTAGTALTLAAILFVAALALTFSGRLGAQPVTTFVRPGSFDEVIQNTSAELFRRGQQIFRFDTFGDERFWSDTLRLHQAVAGARNGGVGTGVSPAAALAAGLKVDVDMVPQAIIAGIQSGAVDLNDPAHTLALINARAVVGVMPAGNGRVGFTCALCHSTVDNSLAPGIGSRLDGWPNRDLNVGAIVAMSPDLSAVASLLQVDQATVRTVLTSWGPGKFDATLFLDGKAFRPDGRTAATLIPPAYGLAGVNLHTYTGWGGVPYWNAFVANLELRGTGVFYDPRLNDATKFPVAARAGLGNVRPASPADDGITSRLPALQYYQLSIPAPAAPAGSFQVRAAESGQALFNGRARCSTCHVPPLFTEPGWAMHTPEEIGIDDFQARRSPDNRYRTTPLKGAWSRAKGGYYHDGRFATLRAVVEHYDRVFSLRLSETEMNDLVEYLKSL
jgi:cytochrome c5/mono/diheme cytochrome c family protein